MTALRNGPLGNIATGIFSNSFALLSVASNIVSPIIIPVKQVFSFLRNIFFEGLIIADVIIQARIHCT